MARDSRIKMADASCATCVSLRVDVSRLLQYQLARREERLLFTPATQLEALFVLNEAGCIVSTREPSPNPGPRFYLVRGVEYQDISYAPASAK